MDPDPPPPQPFCHTPFHQPADPPHDDGIAPYAEVFKNPRDGDIKNDRMFARLRLVLYSTHCVAVAEVQAVHGHAQPPVPAPVHPATEAVAVVAYEGFTATPFPPFHPVLVHPVHHTCHARLAPQVPVASAVPAVPAVPVLPQFHPATPVRIILAVPLRVIVPFEYIAYQAGLIDIPVFTVRFTVYISRVIVYTFAAGTIPRIVVAPSNTTDQSLPSHFE